MDQSMNLELTAKLVEIPDSFTILLSSILLLLYGN